MKRVELVARINYIYQLCSDSKQTSFLYVDLVKPTGKKIIHLLKVLLNYLFYTNMVKETVLEKANNCAQEYSELNAKLNQEQITKEEKKIRANKINRHIDDLKLHLPQLKNQIETLQQRKHKLQENISTLKANDQQLADKIIKLKIEHSELAELLVADDEASSVKEIKQSLTREIETLTETEKELQQAYQIHVSSINQIRPCNALLEKMLLIGMDESCKNLRGAIVELNSLCDKLRKQRNNLTNLSDTLQNNCEELDGLLADKNQELEVRRKVLEKNDRRKDSKHLEQEKRLKALDQANEIYAQLLVVQKAEMQRVIVMVEQALKFIN
ncbi:AGAP004753-PB [Anopheles gambiae str. PEST]|nr:AGAP004753-PB [Anopheles gambiae str. PEST]